MKISTLLIDNGYEARNKSLYKPEVQSYIKQVDNIEIEIEFLTDNKSRIKEDVVVIKEAGVHAQALSYLEMSLDEAMSLTLANGCKVLVVKPEAWVLHKGLTFQRRTNEVKKYKDLYGIWFVLTQLNDISFKVNQDLPKLLKKCPLSWSNTFHNNLKFSMNSATPREWDLLESQDIFGKLTRLSFNQLMKKI
jgi:hypothetical protein